MRPQHDRFGHRLFDQNGTYVKAESTTEKNTTQPTVVNCGRDTGDECTNHKPKPRQHGDECTNTHNLKSKL